MVYGRVNVARGEIDLRLGRDRGDRRRVVASATVGAPSLTRFERLARVAAPRAGLSLLRCRLATGRTHQIRVHLAARGWPLVGDPAYGEPRWSQIVDPALAATLRAFPRQALHAWRVAFTHPVTRERLLLEAPVPRDFEGLLTASGPPTWENAADPSAGKKPSPGHPHPPNCCPPGNGWYDKAPQTPPPLLPDRSGKFGGEEWGEPPAASRQRPFVDVARTVGQLADDARWRTVRLTRSGVR